MHLTPREQERLLLASAAMLGRRRLERGSRLGATEAIALVCDEICELAWDGVPLPDIIDRSRRVLEPDQMLAGVPGLVPVIQVEALFPHGSALVHVSEPFGASAGPEAPGAIVAGDEGVIELAPAHERQQVILTNSGDRPVWISSHFPLNQINRAITCTPSLPGGYRLDLPSGEAVAILAGETRALQAVSFAAAGESAGTT